MTDTAQLLLRPDQAAAALQISRSALYALLRSGALSSVKIGASRRVPQAAIEEYVGWLREQAEAVDGRGTK